MMFELEALLIVAQQRTLCCSSKKKGNIISGGFRDINCRAFGTGPGLLPSPVKTYGSPVLNRALLSPTPRTPSAIIANSSGKSKGEDAKPSKKLVSSSPISISLKDGGKKQRQSRDNVCFSELWAGPAYSNSPPPSSLPIPNFSLKPKRTVSLELPVHESDLNLEPMARSAPASPTRGTLGWSDDFFWNDESATETLCRILNLDNTDD
ncbi:hypothetical protein Cgig2_004064 [Carnegiea gigantea]|uniref:Uncharacterized protein n=1 Tax=Carnegiea gigantea TaxID=171969 RepID=A0A9Q1QP54_9CARY|nr:hypothetical protein Cgig2_004064 [Carnegiea gigantea]